MEHKAWLYPCGRVCWEVRRIIQSLFHDRDKLNISLQIRRERPQWWADLKALGMKWNEHFFPSVLALDSMEQGDGSGNAVFMAEETNGKLDRRFVRGEHSASIEAFLLFMLSWAVRKRKAEQRKQATSMFAALLDRCAFMDGQPPAPIGDLLDEHAHECEEGLFQGRCVHLRGIMLSSVGEQQQPKALWQAVAQLSAMFAQHPHCPSSRLALCAFLKAAAETASERVDEAGDADINRWSRMKGNVKQRRGDEDFKRFLIVDKVRTNKASKASASIVGSEVARTTGQGWIFEQTRSYLGLAWSLPGANCKRVYSLTEDGARFGNPMVETQIYVVWSGAKRQAVWLPPQDWWCTSVLRGCVASHRTRLTRSGGFAYFLPIAYDCARRLKQ